MDSRLPVIAWDGNVQALNKLYEEDKRILHTASLTGGETPLHIACLAGHVHFVQELIKLMPGFAQELNQDGFCPLHIASAKGYVEIVRELIRIDQDLCLIEGIENKIPLHCAVIKGKAEVVKELISVNTDSLDNVTAREESSLHLAVKNNQFQVFRVLVEHIKQANKEGVLNMKDDQGNTILHLAVSRKLYQVVNLLLNEQVIPKGTMDLNSSNKRGLTPLDVLQLFQSEAGDREIEDILRRAGAKTSQELLSPTNITGHQIEHGQSHLPTRQLDNVDSDQIINFFLVVAILVLTATYQALQNPPGGFWQDDKEGVAGKSVFATKNPYGFKVYVLFNTIGFIVSMNLIEALTTKLPLRAEIFISLFALSFTYGSALFAILPENHSNAIFFLFCIGSSIVVWFLIDARRNILKKRSNVLTGLNRESV